MRKRERSAKIRQWRHCGAQRKACLAGEACAPLSAYNVQSCFESLCCASIFAQKPCLSSRKCSCARKRGSGGGGGGGGEGGGEGGREGGEGGGVGVGE